MNVSSVFSQISGSALRGKAAFLIAFFDAAI